MNTYYCKDGQSFTDVCLMTYGTLDKYAKLLNDNGLSPEDAPYSAQPVLWGEESATVTSTIEVPTLSVATYATSPIPASSSGGGSLYEEKANKTDVMAGNTASSVKYLSAKGVYDWVVSLGYITSSALTGYATQSWVNAQGFITNVITSLGYTPENTANKSTSTGDSASSVKFPVWSAVVSYASATYQAILTATNFGSFVNGLTSKTTPVDADFVVLMDSADSNTAKKVSYSNLKLSLLKHELIGIYTGQSTVTMTSASTLYLLQSIYIPANTFVNGDAIYIKARAAKNISGSTARTIQINTDTSAGTGGTQLAIYAAGSSGSRYAVPIERLMDITSTGVYGFEPTASYLTDLTGTQFAVTLMAGIPVDWTVNRYINVLGLSSSAGAQMDIYSVEVWRYRA